MAVALVALGRAATFRDLYASQHRRDASACNMLPVSCLPASSSRTRRGTCCPWRSAWSATLAGVGDLPRDEQEHAAEYPASKLMGKAGRITHRDVLDLLRLLPPMPTRRQNIIYLTLVKDVAYTFVVTSEPFCTHPIFLFRRIHVRVLGATWRLGAWRHLAAWRPSAPLPPRRGMPVSLTAAAVRIRSRSRRRSRSGVAGVRDAGRGSTPLPCRCGEAGELALEPWRCQMAGRGRSSTAGGSYAHASDTM